MRAQEHRREACRLLRAAACRAARGRQSQGSLAFPPPPLRATARRGRSHSRACPPTAAAAAREASVHSTAAVRAGGVGLSRLRIDPLDDGTNRQSPTRPRAFRPGWRRRLAWCSMRRPGSGGAGRRVSRWLRVGRSCSRFGRSLWWRTGRRRRGSAVRCRRGRLRTWPRRQTWSSRPAVHRGAG